MGDIYASWGLRVQGWHYGGKSNDKRPRIEGRETYSDVLATTRWSASISLCASMSSSWLVRFCSPKLPYCRFAGSSNSGASSSYIHMTPSAARLLSPRVPRNGIWCDGTHLFVDVGLALATQARRADTHPPASDPGKREVDRGVGVERIGGPLCCSARHRRG